MAVLRLSGEGATLPFIARYRKEVTGNLDEVAIQKILEAKILWDDIATRKEFILKEIESQGQLTEGLKARISATFNLNDLEDLYLPFKKKRKTKATIAKEAGLEPLADWIWEKTHATSPTAESLDTKAATFINEALGIAEAQAAIEGAQAILIERMSETLDLRQFVRTRIANTGFLVSLKATKAKEHSKFELYFDYRASIKSLMEPGNSHRYLAMRRGEQEEELTLSIGGDNAEAKFDAELLTHFEQFACRNREVDAAKSALFAARMALRVYVLPSIAAEVHATLKGIADEAAIKVFSENLRSLLLAAPLGAKTVLGVDPGLRTGCKLALVDKSGRYVANSVVHLHNDQERDRLRALLQELSKNAALQAIAIGNGTASRETESAFRKAIDELKLKIPVVVVSEAGASVYSASEVAREEFPELDLTVRGAISIARRLQDPLAELVKVDPKSIGVGQYQHDVSQPALKTSLERTVESCVNGVGVNLNTASQHLLAYVSGIGSSLAKAIVEYRQQHGLFQSREDLLNIPRFGEKAFEQAAGFLRVADGSEPLDNTGVHPEKYPLLQSYASELSKSVSDLLGAGVSLLKADKAFKEKVGEFTFKDIIQELEKPGRDPRETFVAFEFLKDIHEVRDLRVGMICPGIVTNVTNFGAFVDIGVHQDGLVHISQLSNTFVKDPRTVVNPGDKVKVKVLEVNLEKNQIALTMKLDSDVQAPSGPRVTREDSRTGGHNNARGGGQGRHYVPKQDEFKNTPFAALLSLKK